MSWRVYMLRCGDGSFYTGITNDMDARLAAHEAGTGAKYTRGRGPLELIYQERHESRSAASVREYEIKKLRRGEKLMLIRHCETVEKI